MVSQVEKALATVEARLSRSFPGRTWDTIEAGMRSQVHAFTADVSELGGRCNVRSHPQNQELRAQKLTLLPPLS